MKTRRYFSLIELLIVIGIMGALAALILPAFSDSESAAKDTACDYNQAGTLRYLKMFHSANGVYPTGFHTGGSGAAVWETPENDGPAVVLTTCGTYNFGTASVSKKVGTGEELTGGTESLANAGIVTLAYGQGKGAGMIKIKGEDAGTIQVKTVVADATAVNGKTTTSWSEELDPVEGTVPAGEKEALAFRGVALGYIAHLGQADTPVDAAYKQFRADNEPKFSIVPLYVAPTIDWEHYYSDGANDSKISIAMPGKCPWGTDGEARYYIAFFKVYEDGSAAKLLCTSCPDCGILEANAF